MLQTKVHVSLLDLIRNSFITLYRSVPTQPWGCNVHRGCLSSWALTSEPQTLVCFSKADSLWNLSPFRKAVRKIKVKVNDSNSLKVRSWVDLSWLNYHFNFIPWQLQHLPLNWWKERHAVCSELTFSSKRAGAGLHSDESALCCNSFLQTYGRWLTPALTLYSSKLQPALNCSCDTDNCSLHLDSSRLIKPHFIQKKNLLQKRL